MISSLKISGYRAFERFEMTDLGRVNFLVGRNNTGETSILEGLYILASGINMGVLWQVLARRGEQVMPEPNPNRPFQAEVDISHLFHGHEISRALSLRYRRQMTDQATVLDTGSMRRNRRIILNYSRI